MEILKILKMANMLGEHIRDIYPKNIKDSEHIE